MLPSGVRRVFRLLRGARDVSREVDEEIRFHFDAAVAALMATGMSEWAAREEAERRFGDVDGARATLMRIDRRLEATRSVGAWLDGVVQDGRMAVRGVTRSPGLTVAVVVMLGLGIGGAAAMFGLLDRLLLRVGPHVAAPADLRRLYFDTYDAYFAHARVFSSSLKADQVRALAAAFGDRAHVASMAALSDRLGGPGGPDVPVTLVSGRAFEVLGTHAVIGRLIEPADDRPAAEPVAVISHGLWTRRFAKRPDVLGQALQVGPMHYTVVGVAPEGFSGLRPDRVDVWVPIDVGAPVHYGPHWRQSARLFDVVVRIRAPVDELALAAMAQRSYRALAGPGSDTTARAVFAPVAPYQRPGKIGEVTRLSIIVAGVAAILCLIAVANATNLLLLRAVARRRETAVRLALGVSRGRLVRGVIIESVVLALSGAAAAGAVALWGGALLQRLIVGRDWQQGIVDARVLAFAGLTGLIIGVVTGLIPGWQASRPDAIAALKSGARSSPAPSRLRAGLLGLQAALTVALLAGLGLYARSFYQARATDYVVDADHLIVVAVDRAAGDAGAPATLAAELTDQVTHIPGVRAVAHATSAPMYSYGGAPLRIQDVDSFAMDRSGPFIAEIDTAFLGVTGLALLRGRAFTAADVASGAPVALVNDAFARRFWPGNPALGKCLYVGPAASTGAAVCRQVVGVISSYRNRLREDAPMQNYYLPLGDRWAGGSRMLVVRTAEATGEITQTIARLVQRRLPDADPMSVMATSDIVAGELEPWRNGATLFGVFATLAVLLAMGGMYSVAAFTVAQRGSEFAIRVAVGARGRDLVRLVLRMAFGPVVVGALCGLAVTSWLVHYLAPLLYQVGPRDPLAFSAAVAALLLVTAIASGPSASAALRTDPRRALQAE